MLTPVSRTRKAPLKQVPSQQDDDNDEDGRDMGSHNKEIIELHNQKFSNGGGHQSYRMKRLSDADDRLSSKYPAAVIMHLSDSVAFSHF